MMAKSSLEYGWEGSDTEVTKDIESLSLDEIYHNYGGNCK